MACRCLTVLYFPFSLSTPFFIAVSAAFTAASLRHDKRVRNDAASDGFRERGFLSAKAHAAHRD